MGKFENLSNNQILTEIKQIQAEHEATKTRILNDLNRLDELEILFKDANDTILDRVKGKKNE